MFSKDNFQNERRDTVESFATDGETTTEQERADRGLDLNKQQYFATFSSIIHPKNESPRVQRF